LGLPIRPIIKYITPNDKSGRHGVVLSQGSPENLAFLKNIFAMAEVAIAVPNKRY